MESGDKGACTLGSAGYTFGVKTLSISAFLLATLGTCVLSDRAAGAASIVKEGIGFQVIGKAGNRAIQVGEAESFRVGRGSVGYEYGLSTTEITVAQYYQFVDAYGKVSGYPNGSLLGRGIALSSSAESGYVMNAGLAQYSAMLTWTNAARYCNWLHNGRANEAWAFESGAYDLRDMREGTGISRAATAKYWIPNLDEWLKGVFFDANRHGEGTGGFWQRPGGTNDYLVTGFPGQGGQTDAGWNPDPSVAPFVSVGSFPSIAGPWGLLDTSGGEREWIEDMFGDSAHVAMGSMRNDAFWFLEDDISWQGNFFDAESVLSGFRIATEIPGPASWLLGIPFMINISRKRK